MKKLLALFSIFLIICCGAILKATLVKKSILIYTSMEEYAVALLQKRLDEKFPEYNIKFVTKSTSEIATKVEVEGAACEADIVFGLEYAYIQRIVGDNLAYNFDGRYDMSVFEDDLAPDELKDYTIPSCREGISIIVNNSVLEEKNLPKPTSYLDLTNPIYKGLISMPSPASSGTGYAFYLAMVNLLGEEEALKYFDDFAKNVNTGFTSSGSGPVNALKTGEVGIGIGMISQAVEEISGGHSDLEVVVASEGAAYNLYGSFVVNGKEDKHGVLEIIDYMYNEFTDECCAMYYPEATFKGKDYELENFPQNLRYCDMSNNTTTRKEDLLKEWKY